MDDGRTIRTATHARQATKEGVVRYVLAGGLILTIFLFEIAYFSVIS
jgi:hypothetical protein